MSKIIVSYRRNDTQAIAGRIRDRLAAEYGADCVFMDIDSIPLGRDFRAHIKESMAGSDVLVAIIGPKWLGEKRGKRARIDNPNDPVRVEIETALQLNLDIVPVLVDDAVMPAAADLPASIQEFSYLHAATIDDGLDFHQHMNRLIRGLDELNPRKPVATLARKKYLVPSLSLVLAFAVGALALFMSPGMFPTATKNDALATKAINPKPPENSRASPPGIGGPLQAPNESASSRRKAWPPPSPRSYWELTWDSDRVLVYLEPTGLSRELYFAEVTEKVAKQGIELGDLLFEGRRSNNMYEGRVYLYAGDCGRFPYDVTGTIIQDTTVEMKGKAPRINRDCRQARAIGDQFIFDEKTLVIKLKHTR